MGAAPMTDLRIFLGHPSDAEAEAESIRSLAAGLQTYLDTLQQAIEPKPFGRVQFWGWRDDSVSGVGGQEATISPEIDRSQIGVFVFRQRPGEVTFEELERFRQRADPAFVIALFPESPSGSLVDPNVIGEWLELNKRRASLSKDWAEREGKAVKPQPLYASDADLLETAFVEIKKAMSTLVSDTVAAGDVHRISDAPSAVGSGDPVPTKDIARHLENASRVELMLAGGDSFYRQLYEALRWTRRDRTDKLDVRVLLRRSSLASVRSAHQLRALCEAYPVTVEVLWYDWDFMLRGYCFDRQHAYVSYFLRKGDVLTGRYNPIVHVRRSAGGVERTLLDMFCDVFDAHYGDPAGDPDQLSSREFVVEP